MEVRRFAAAACASLLLFVGCFFPDLGDLTGGTPDAANDVSTDVATPDAGDAGDAGNAGDGGDASKPSYASVVQSDNPTSYWRFGEKSVQLAAHDEMGVADGTYASAGTTVGATGAIAGDPDTAVSFAAAGGSVTIGDVYPFAGTAPFTLEVWVSAAPPVDGGTTRRIASHRTGPPSYGWRLLLASDSQQVTFERWENDSVVASVGGALTSGFHHLVVAQDGTTLHFYVNGAEVDSAPASTTTAQSMPLVWGANSLGDGEFLEGTIDEAAIYDHALAQNRVQAHYLAGIGQ